MKKLMILILVVSVSFLYPQSSYKKKVVSYINTVLAPKSYNLSAGHLEYASSKVSRAIVMERFQYASLPENIIAQFSDEAKKMSSYNSLNVQPLIEKTLAPKLLEILDINKELLSKQNLSEAERNTFLATKAQSAGLSASQLESILNSGFFYVPYIEQYERSTSRGERDIKNDEGKVIRKQKFTTYTHEIKLGLLWYKLNVDRSNAASVAFAGVAKGWGGDAISRSESQDDGSDGNADWSAYTEAVDVSAINIMNETKKIEEFILSGGVTEITTFGMKINLGTLEGIGLDDSYWVEELVEDERGEIKKERRGFVKIREVGNNKKDESAFSYAQTITGTNYSPGLNVKEIPLLGINGLGGFGKIPIKISKFDTTFNKFILPEGKSFWMRIDEDYSGMYGPMISLQADLANSTKVSELWFQLGAAIGFPNPSGKFFFTDFLKTPIPNGYDNSKNAGPGLGGYINAGLLKKFYFRRFGLILQTDFRFNMTYLSDKGKDKNGDDLTYSLLHSAFGFDAKAGLEIYLSPTFSIGGGAEYSGAPVSDTWSVTVTDKDNNDTKLKDATGPKVNYSGLGWFVWFNYSLPSLN